MYFCHSKQRNALGIREMHRGCGLEVRNGIGHLADLDINGDIMSRMGCKVGTEKSAS